MLHLRLGSLCLLQLDVQLLQFRLRAAELRHSLIVVHLLDLVVLELLLVQFLSTWRRLAGLFVDCVEVGALLRRDQIRCGRVVLENG